MLAGDDPFACFDMASTQPGEFGRLAFHSATRGFGTDQDNTEADNKKAASSKALDSAFGGAFDPFAFAIGQAKQTKKTSARPRQKSLRELRQEKEAGDMDPFTGIPDNFDVAAVDVVAVPAPTSESRSGEWGSTNNVAEDELDAILFGDGFGASMNATAPSSKSAQPVVAVASTEDEESDDEDEDTTEDEEEVQLNGSLPPALHGEALYRTSSKRIFKKWKECYMNCSPDTVLSIYPSKDEWMKGRLDRDIEAACRMGTEIKAMPKQRTEGSITIIDQIYLHALMTVGDIYEKEDVGSSKLGDVWQMKITENSPHGENAVKMKQLRIWRFDDVRLEAAERLKIGATGVAGKVLLESLRERLVAKISNCQRLRLMEVSNSDKKKMAANEAARKEQMKRKPRPPKPARDPLAIDQHVY